MLDLHDEYLSEEELTALHKLVSERLNTILDQSRRKVQEYTEVREVQADPVDVASSETDLAFNQRLGERDRRMVSKLKLALERMKEGEYGVCERCGDPIGYRRLLARPVATQCIDCKTTTEMLEGGRGRRG
ncbi:MAG: TraR/DksA C4-type zinc finger protein [Alphaproteobacteria bacterium]|nr:TraR/DksA C4-type zinc finger protein [Alphaproteobacteria bacterium]